MATSKSKAESKIESKSESKSEIKTESKTEIKTAQTNIPSSTEIGLEANRKGNFKMARQMLRAALEQLDGQEDKHLRAIELMTYIADSYLNEGRHDSAKIWYSKAFDRAQASQGSNALPNAALAARLAEIDVLSANMAQFNKSLENIQRIYLLANETDFSLLLTALTDLSWALCVKGYLAEVKPVNDLIAQIKQVQDEDKASGIVAA